MIGIADQPATLGVDDPVERFQRDLTDEDGVLIVDLADIKGAVTSLDRQPRGAVDRQTEVAAQPARVTYSERFKPSAATIRLGSKSVVAPVSTTASVTSIRRTWSSGKSPRWAQHRSSRFSIVAVTTTLPLHLPGTVLPHECFRRRAMDCLRCRSILAERKRGFRG